MSFSIYRWASGKINAVHQEVVLCPHLTVAANLFLGDEKVKFGILQHGEMVREGQKILDAGRRDAVASDDRPTTIGCDGSSIKTRHEVPDL
jgi:ABC-type sugar transport system ATPase subunit